MIELLEGLKKARGFPAPYLEHLADLLGSYRASGFASPNLIREVATGDLGKIYSALWEAMLYRHFTLHEIELENLPTKKAGREGPDFALRIGGKRIWVEAIAPMPVDIPKEWLEQPRPGIAEARGVPHDEMLCRWVRVLRTKKDVVAKYLAKGIVEPGDGVIVAINGCGLGDYFVDGNGISRLPRIVEAVLPIGPMGIPVRPDGTLGPAEQMFRPSVRDSNGAIVRTDNFLLQEYAIISAAIGAVSKDMLNDRISLSLIHNPLGTNPIPLSSLGVTDEYSAAIDDGSLVLNRVG
nr:hypothetical protein [uncultured Dongia sp.]